MHAIGTVVEIKELDSLAPLPRGKISGYATLTDSAKPDGIVDAMYVVLLDKGVYVDGRTGFITNILVHPSNVEIPRGIFDR